MDRGSAAGAGRPDSALSRKLKGPRNCKFLRKPGRSARQRPSGVRLCLLPSGSRAPTRPPLRGESFGSLPRPHEGSPSRLEPVFVWASPGSPASTPCPLDMSVGYVRWIYPLTYGGPRSVSRTRCLHLWWRWPGLRYPLLPGTNPQPAPAQRLPVPTSRGFHLARWHRRRRRGRHPRSRPLSTRSRFKACSKGSRSFCSLGLL